LGTPDSAVAEQTRQFLFVPAGHSNEVGAGRSGERPGGKTAKINLNMTHNCCPAQQRGLR
jgi:hypothetical protein